MILVATCEAWANAVVNKTRQRTLHGKSRPELRHLEMLLEMNLRVAVLIGPAS
jgi:hypothetical protein